MKKFSQIFLLSLVIKVGYSQSIDRRLIGDWISNEGKVNISFTDSTIGFLDWGDFVRCYTKNDSIFFNRIPRKEKVYSYLNNNKRGPRIIKTIINGIDTLGTYSIVNDTLEITSSNDSYYWEWVNQRYVKLEPLNNIVFDSLYMATSTCHGFCPAMEMMLFSNGNLYFKGNAYTEKLGVYKGVLTSEMLKLVINKVNQLNFKAYDSLYTADHTDGQTRALFIYHNNNKEYINIYGHDNEPLEINVLFSYLTELYKYVELQEIENEIIFDEYEIVFPPPPSYLIEPKERIIDIYQRIDDSLKEKIDENLKNLP